MATKTTVGQGAGHIEWRRPRGARAAADSRWFGGEAAERPTFLEMLGSLVALALGSLFAIAIVIVLAFALLSLIL